MIAGASPDPASDLRRKILGEIAAHGPLSFARFMELALYDPDGGYYTGRAARIGRQGDYVTASDFGHAFGRALARQVLDFDHLIGPLDPFHVVEFGGARGLLARDLLDALAELAPGLAARCRYVLVERSARHRELARRLVPEAEVVGPEQKLPQGLAGCAIAVELFDALPAHRLRRRDGRLVELRVGADAAGRFVELEAPAPRALAELAERYGAAAEEGTEAELAPAATDALETMACALERGFLVIVDYGERAEALYGPERPDGTLLAYHRQRTTNELLARAGEQDLTAHVNFSLLEDHARVLGLDVRGLTTQDRFLVANGILEEFVQTDVAASRDPELVRRRLRAWPLIHPGAMGRRFKVLVLSRGTACASAPRGLGDPFAR